jgi:hypothetical protein
MGEGETGGKYGYTVARLPQFCALVLVRVNIRCPATSLGAAFIAGLRRPKPGMVSSTPPLRVPLYIGRWDCCRRRPAVRGVSCIFPLSLNTSCWAKPKDSNALRQPIRDSRGIPGVTCEIGTSNSRNMCLISNKKPRQVKPGLVLLGKPLGCHPTTSVSASIAAPNQGELSWSLIEVALQHSTIIARCHRPGDHPRGSCL